MVWKAAHFTEVFNVDIDTTSSTDEAQEILSALRQIQNDAELRAEAASNPEGVMDRLGVSGIARHAVAFGIAGLLAAPVVARYTSELVPNNFWGT
jgi:hypothetical protein